MMVKDKYDTSTDDFLLRYDINSIETDWSAPTEFPDLRQCKTMAIDLETRDAGISKGHGPGWATNDGYVVGIAVAAGDFHGYFPIRHENGPNLDEQLVKRWLAAQLNTPDIQKVFHNAPYDVGWLGAEGIEVKGQLVDTLIAAPLVDENRLTYRLDALGREYLGIRKDEKLLRKAAEEWGLDPKKDMWRLPARYVGGYAEQDAVLTLKLWEHLKTELTKQDLWAIFDLESRVLPGVIDMRRRGVRVDLDRAEQSRQALRSKVQELKDYIKRESGVDVEPWAAESVKKVFDALDLPYLKTDTGQPSFTKDFLKDHPHEVARSINKLREADKADSTFIDSILDYEHNGRIHCEMHQLRSDDGGTVTGRFCVAADTLIETQRGPIPIVDIKPREDSAVTHLGRLQPIRHLIYKGQEKMVALRVSSGEVLKCTRNHRVLTAGGWKRVGELTIGQEISGVGIEKGLGVSDGSSPSNFAFAVTVEEIKPLGVAQVWDIEVETDHSYVAHGLIHHNSSSNPNLQQIPARDPEIKKLIRGIFVPEEGEMWGSFDYASQEPRLLTHFAASMPPRMRDDTVDAIVSDYHEGGADLHQMVADMAGITRKEAKAVNLGIMYGMGGAKLADQLSVSVERAKELLAMHREKVPFVKRLAEAATKRAEREGKIRTILGRQCRFDLWEPATFGYHKPMKYDEAQKEYGSVGQSLKRAFTYKALNRLIQGSAADQTKLAFAQTYEEGMVPLLQVHDELCFSVSSQEQADQITEIMEQGLELKVPSKVDQDLKSNWGEIE